MVSFRHASCRCRRFGLSAVPPPGPEQPAGAKFRSLYPPESFPLSAVAFSFSSLAALGSWAALQQPQAEPGTARHHDDDDRCHCSPPAGVSCHHSGRGPQLLLAARRRQPHSRGAAHFPHDHRCSGHLRFLCLDSFAHHLPPGKNPVGHTSAPLPFPTGRNTSGALADLCWIFRSEEGLQTLQWHKDLFWGGSNILSVLIEVTAFVSTFFLTGEEVNWVQLAGRNHLALCGVLAERCITITSSRPFPGPLPVPSHFAPPAAAS